MSDGKRKHPRINTSLAVDVRIASRSDTTQVSYSGIAQARDVGLAGLKLRLEALDPQLILACARHEMLVLMTVHLNASETMEVTAEIKWAQNTAGSSALLGVEYREFDAAKAEKIVAWGHRTNDPIAAPTSRAWRFVAAAAAVLLVVQTVRLFTTNGTPEERAVSGKNAASVTQKKDSNQAQHESAQRATQAPVDKAPRVVTDTSSNYQTLELSPKAQEKVDSFNKEPRDEAWAAPAERSFRRDFDRLLDKMPAAKKRAWGVEVASVECRRTKCMAKVKSKGYAQWLGFVETAIYNQGYLDSASLPFDMKCTPTAIQSEIQGAVPIAMADYQSNLLLDCHKPVYAPMPPAPDPSKDRLLNPALRAKLPANYKVTDEAVARADGRYKKEQEAWSAEKARRDDPNFLRVEPK